MADFREGREARTIGRVGIRLNYERAGMSSLFRKTGRRVRRIDEGPFKEALTRIDERWGDLATWRLIQRESGFYTASYYLAALDLRFGPAGEVVRQPEHRRIYLTLFGRTLWLALVITALCLLLGHPISYLKTTLPTSTSTC